MIASRSTDKIEYVYSQDPAINKDSAEYNWEKFVETGDRKYLPIRDGHLPTVFSLQRLPRTQFLRVLKMDRVDQASEAVALGLKDVKNWGGPLELKFKEQDGQDRLTPDTLEKMFAVELFAELGVRIMELSTLAPLS